MIRLKFSELRLFCLLCATLLLPANALAQGAKEALTLHGNWVIEVRDADGTLRERRAFENAITSGALVLSELASRGAVLNYWWIVAASSATVPHRGPCVADFLGCYIRESADPQQPVHTKNLVVTRVGPTVSNPTAPNGVNLQGSFVVGVDSDIAFVDSNVQMIIQLKNVNSSFSHKTLATPIVVKKTQTVSVSVTISMQ
jgi:hypothetical protein